MRRTGWILVGSTFFVLLTMPQAHAGGSWLEPSGRYFAHGDAVVARGAFSLRGAYEGRLADGPYHAYLLPGFRGLRTRSIPAYAIPLGPITFEEGNRYGTVARLEFTVPDVSPGLYSIDYCNIPCTVDGIGDLLGGSLWIGATANEARLLARLDSASQQLEDARRRAGRLAEEARHLSAGTETLEAELGASEAARRDLILQLDQARTSLQEDGGGRPLVNPWVGIVFAAGCAVLACALIIGRRLRPVGEGRKIGTRAGEGGAVGPDEEPQGVVRSPDRELAGTAPMPKN